MAQNKLHGSVKMDMLHGGLLGKMLMFALPLAASSMLQQLFNSVDVAVVGRFAGSEALAAVGSNSSLINLLINLFVGISVGANVLIANYIGQNDQRGIRRSVRTVAVLAIGSGILLTLLGVFAARPILEWMNTPADVIELSTLYLQIYFLGMPFIMAYNFGAAILRSMGDTKRPLYSLLWAGLLNVVLNLIFVIGFGMGVEGVAIATVVANMLSAGMVVRWLILEELPFKLELKKITIYPAELKKMLRIGVPAGIQSMVFSLANVFIQSAVNGYGSAAVAGSAAAINYEHYCYYLISAFSQTTVTFTSQNFGAGLVERCKRVFRQCMWLSVIGCGLLNVLIVWQDDFFISFFSTTPEVMHYASIRLQNMLLFQFLASSYEISGAALRGMGYSMTPTLITIFGTCVLRLVWVAVLGHVDYALLLLVFPLSWVITGSAVLTAYFVIRKREFQKMAVT